MKNKKPRRERMYDDTVCLQRDSLDLLLDEAKNKGVDVDSFLRYDEEYEKQKEY